MQHQRRLPRSEWSHLLRRLRTGVRLKTRLPLVTAIALAACIACGWYLSSADSNDDTQSDIQEEAELLPPTAAAWKRRIDEQFAWYSGITEESVHNTWMEVGDLYVQILGNRMWVLPAAAPRHVAPAESLGLYATFQASSLVSIFRMTAAFRVPNVTLTFGYHDFCGANVRPEALMRANLSISPLQHGSRPMAPPLYYNGAHWHGSTLQCRCVAFPGYDWAWPGQSFFEDAADRRSVAAAAAGVAWADRQSKLIFRGQGHCSFGHLPGEARCHRVRAAKLALEHPDLLDVKMSASSACGDAPCPAKLTGGWVSPSEQLLYKYTLDIDGLGSTFRMKFLLLSGYVIFKVDSVSYQWFYGDLLPWMHYIPVSAINFEEDLLEKLRWAVDHDEQAQAIAENAVRFARERLSDLSVAEYQQMVLERYAELQSEPMTRPRAGSIEFCCSDLLDPFLKAKMEAWEHLHALCNSGQGDHRTACRKAADASNSVLSVVGYSPAVHGTV